MNETHCTDKHGRAAEDAARVADNWLETKEPDGHYAGPFTHEAIALFAIAFQLKALRLLLEAEFTKAPVLRYVLPETFCGTPAITALPDDLARKYDYCLECGKILVPPVTTLHCPECSAYQNEVKT